MSPNPPKGVPSTSNLGSHPVGGAAGPFGKLQVPHPDPSLFTPAIHVDSLDIEALPIGATTRLLVDLVHDGFGRAVSVPVMVARGRKPGPVFGLTAAVHGNELNGIPVIHRLFEKLDHGELRGTLVAVVVANISGFVTNQRELLHGRDMNHVFPGRPNGNVSQVYAHRLVERVINRVERLLDLHTASFGRVNSLYVRADLSDRDSARMAYLLRPQIVLHNSPSDLTLRGHVRELGHPSITIEIGDPQRFQSEFIRSTLTGVRRILTDCGMLQKRSYAPAPAPVICESSRWVYTDHGGLLEVLPKLTDQVEKGEPIARLRDIFGQVTRTYEAPYDGIIIGHSTNPVAQTGARIIHLGRIAQSGDPRFPPPDMPPPSRRPAPPRTDP